MNSNTHSSPGPGRGPGAGPGRGPGPDRDPGAGPGGGGGRGPGAGAGAGPGAGGLSGRLAQLAAVMDGLDADDLTGLPDVALVEQVLELRWLVDRLEGQWLRYLAALDARGAAGTDQGVPVGSTAAWLRGRLRLGAGAAAGFVRTARALFRGPLTATAEALTNGQISAAHASVLAHGT
jgi:hypothetical protein